MSGFNGYNITIKKRREPLISFADLLHEFGCSKPVLQGMMRRTNAPKPILVSRGSSAVNQISWYEAKAVRAWRAELLKDKK